MPKLDRPHIRVGITLPEDDKLLGLSRADRQAVIGLCVIAWIRCDLARSDGYIRASRWSTLGTARARRLALARGFAVEVEGGVQMHNYLDWNRSRADREAKGEAARKAARQRWDADAERNAERTDQADAERNAERIPGQDAERTADRNADRNADETRREKTYRQPQSQADVEGTPEAAAADLTAEELELAQVVQRQAGLRGRSVDLVKAATLAQLILPEGRAVTNPAGYIQRVIRDEPAMLDRLDPPQRAAPARYQRPAAYPEPEVAEDGAALARQLMKERDQPPGDTDDEIPF